MRTNCANCNLAPAFAAWNANRLYIDNNGNYRLKRDGHTNGPIAPWNKDIKRLFPDVTDFHNAAVLDSLTT
jgi:hypothetical protein